MSEIIVFGNKKGGVGKSMTSVNLAGAIVARAVREGRDPEHCVIIVDADTNESVLKHIRRREAFSEKLKELGEDVPSFIKVELKKPEDRLSRDLIALSKIYEYVIVDTGGYENEAFKSAVGVSTAVYLPFQPAQVDIEQLIPTLFMIKNVETNYQEIKGDDDFRINARLMLTLVDHNDGDLFKEAKAVSHKLLDYASISGVTIPRVKAIRKIQEIGLTLSDKQPNAAKTKLTTAHPKRATFELLLNEIDGERKVEVERNEPEKIEA